ncbi:MAG: tRNA (adenosine(37)-N6)-threonylcarbamoyltransferase complex dimerization subunit type 1 TsaB [Chloracidobacterium sp.]|nr:tRNA (adenosine(37)-N6)-threonylcarbamoyltransferase complex dimerization subunit type 1 TsaB [Chloracidobacterium sp.]
MLAIESAIGGGSIALYSNGERIDGMIGSTLMSRAEDLLPNIDLLLKRNALSISDVNEVVVSNGPGSFTGIRIGLATAMGLAAAGNLRLRRVSALEAIAWTCGRQGEFVVVLPVGRETVCIQTFVRSNDGLTSVTGPEPLGIAELIETTNDDVILLVHPLVQNMLPKGNSDKLFRIESDISNYLAQAATKHQIRESNEPLFVGKRK